MFSTRLPERLAPNALSRALAALRQSGATLLDLTETNPTLVGLPYPADVLAPLADARGIRYGPHPRGLLDARQAVSADYARQGVSMPAERIVLTASTSEAYGLLFKLLCDPGEGVLVPQPSYPLFDLLTRLDAVPARPYRLEYHGVWSIDRASVEQGIASGARALLVVSPNNPTGSVLRRSDRQWLAALGAGRGLAIVADEVFADYPLAPVADGCRFAGESGVLTFALGGLSKSAGLPQVKLGWIAVSGPEALVDAALDRLDLIGDTYLSVSTSVQIAAARLIASGQVIRAAIAGRLARNLAALRARVAAHPAVTLLAPEAGWSAVLQVPAVASDESVALRVLEDAHVVTHPGYFFDMPAGAFLVISLLPDPAVFDAGVERVLAVAGEGRAS
jgi:alanine-synthesizing transaminase